MYPLRNERGVAPTGVLPTRGLYVVIPPEFRSWGVVPADWFIDDLVRHLGRRYYVALLSAAASHQAPQVFPVIADRRVLDRVIERVDLGFFVSEHIAETPTQMVTVHTGSIPVSSREATVVDLVREPRASGGISNVATILSEIGELDGSALPPSPPATAARSHAARDGWSTTTAPVRPSARCVWPRGSTWGSPSC